MEKDRQIPWIIIVIVILGVIISGFLVLTETNIIFKQNQFIKKVILESDQEQDFGYIRLARDDRTPSIVDYAEFENGLTYTFFSISDESIVEKIYFDTPELESGTYYFKYEARFGSGKVESGEISFRVI